MNKFITDDIWQRMKKEVEERAEKIIVDFISREFPDPNNGNLNYFRIQDKIESRVCEIFSQRFIAENFDKIAEKINLDRVIKMAELRTVGLTLNKE